MNRKASHSAARGLGERDRRLAPLVLAGLAGVAVAVDVGRSIVEVTRGTRANVATPAAVPASTPSAPFDLPATGALFGHAADDSAGVPAEQAAELELTGTVSLVNAESGFGIIRRRSEAERTYRVGDVLPGGARLAEVYASHVIVETAGQRASLWLPHAAFGLALAANPAQRVAQRQDELVAMSPQVPRTRAARMQHPVNVPGSPIVRALHPRPVIADDHVLGYRMSSNGGGPAIPGLPLNALVREIDGVQLTDGAVTARALQAMAARGTATFVIRAGDGEKTVTLDVSRLGQLDP